MKFKFPFETLMKDRLIKRDEAQKEYQLARAKLDEQLQKLATMKHQQKRAYKEAEVTVSVGGQAGSKLKSIETFITGQKIRIQSQTKVIKGLEELLEQKRLVLVEAAKELKILEKLKEKRYNEFKVLRRKKEQKEMDEVSILRATREVI